MKLPILHCSTHFAWWILSSEAAMSGTKLTRKLCLVSLLRSHITSWYDCFTQFLAKYLDNIATILSIISQAKDNRVLDGLQSQYPAVILTICMLIFICYSLFIYYLKLTMMVILSFYFCLIQKKAYIVHCVLVCIKGTHTP